MSLPIDLSPLGIARQVMPISAGTDAVALIEAMAERALRIVRERGEPQDMSSPVSTLWAVELMLAEAASLLVEHHHARIEKLLEAIRKGGHES